MESTVDRMLRVLFNNVSEEILDSLPEFEVAALIAGMWNTFNTDHIYPHDAVKRVTNVFAFRKELNKLRHMPYIAQRSDEWYKLRRQRLTASDVAQALGKGKFGTRDQLIQKKSQEINGNPQPFKVMAPMKWGIMFEPMAMRCYQARNDNIRVHEFGMIPHESMSCFGASPDGITDLGIMTEIKCPYKRKITGEVPDYYELQMQGQMAVCNLKECDYIECDMQVFESYDDYYLIVEDSCNDHGVICEFRRGNDTYYEYSDPLLTAAEAQAWAREFASRTMRQDPDTQLVKIHHWRLRNMFVKRIYFDEKRWAETAEGIEQFWKDVMDAASKVTTTTVNAVSSNEDIVEKKKYTFVAESDSD